MFLNQLESVEYPTNIKVYLDILDNVHLIEFLEISLSDFIKFVQNIPLDKFDYRYAEGKWTIKDIVQHLIDSERIFCYRALRFSRNDRTELSSFDEVLFSHTTDSNKRSIQELLADLSAVRYATLSLFKSFSKEQLLRSGSVSSNRISVRAIGFLILGHQKHHQLVFKEKYL